MRVLVDAVASRLSGAETFVRSLLPELAAQMPEVQFSVLVHGARASVYRGLPETISVVAVDEDRIRGVCRRLIHEHGSVPIRYLRRGEFDLYFRADGQIPPLVYATGVPSVGVLHRTIHLHSPDQLTDSWPALAHGRMVERLAMQYASEMITVSHHAKAELRSAYGRSANRVEVIWHGVDTELFRVADKTVPQFLVERGVRRYFVSVSNRHSHKNYCRLIAAYGSLTRRKNVDEHLVIVGRPVDRSVERDLAQMIADFGIGPRVHLLEYVDQTELPQLYGAATAYVFPSMIETFGLTPLEAMACGTPVLCSEWGVLPEICGDAAAYFDPRESEDICRQMERVLNEKDPLEEQVARGLVHVRRFSWSSAAERYAYVIRRASKGHART